MTEPKLHEGTLEDNGVNCDNGDCWCWEEYQAKPVAAAPPTSKQRDYAGRLRGWLGHPACPAQSVQDDLRAGADQIERLTRELRLAESARDYANDLLERARQRSAVETTGLNQAHETTARVFGQLEGLRGSATAALKWLLSHDPVSAIHAKSILLTALGETESEFFEKWKDHIIRRSPEEPTVTCPDCELSLEPHAPDCPRRAENGDGV